MSQKDTKTFDTNRLVSTIITTYKRNVDVVERAVKSVANQTYTNIELIIINDDPNDIELSNNIKHMLTKYKKLKTTYIVVEKNGGACKARNIGIKESKGYYIAFLDDDDEWMDTKIEEQVHCFETVKSQNVGIVYCNSIVHDEDKNNDKLRYKKTQQSGKLHSKLLFGNFIGSTSFPMFKKSVLEEYNGFREDMPAMQEWELYLRISKKYECMYIEKVLAIYHVYKGERISRNYNSRAEALRKIEDEFSEEIKKDKNIQYSFYIHDCNMLSANKQYSLALKKLKKALFLKPLRIKKNIKIIIKIIINFIKNKNR